MTTKTSQAITEMVSDGFSDEIDLSVTDRATLAIKHVNGTGTITSGAVVIIEVQGGDSTNWAMLQSFILSSVASDVEEIVATVPDASSKVRLNYSSPVGSTGHTLNADCFKVSYAA